MKDQKKLYIKTEKEWMPNLVIKHQVKINCRSPLLYKEQDEDVNYTDIPKFS